MITSPILTLALDRIQQLHEEPTEGYRENLRVDLATHYDDVIGVTKTPGQKSTEVLFRINHANAPYVVTKPLHASQRLLGTNEDGLTFSIRVVLNFELERELLGFGGKITVLAPRILKKQIEAELAKALRKYNAPDGSGSNS